MPALFCLVLGAMYGRYSQSVIVGWQLHWRVNLQGTIRAHLWLFLNLDTFITRILHLCLRIKVLLYLHHPGLIGLCLQSIPQTWRQVILSHLLSTKSIFDHLALYRRKVFLASILKFGHLLRAFRQSHSSRTTPMLEVYRRKQRMPEHKRSLNIEI